MDVSDSDGLETSITVGRDLTIGTLTAGANTIILSGSRDLTINSTDAAGINATSMRGDLTIIAYTGTTKLVASGGRGINNIAAGNNGAVTEYTGGQGVDILDASTVTNGTLDLELNGGNDVLKLGAASASGLTIALDGGSGTDTIHLSNGTNLVDIRTFALRSVEQFELENRTPDTKDDKSMDTVMATLAGSQLSGTSYTILTDEADDDATLTVVADEASTDLGSLRLRNIDMVEITGMSSAETIVGTSGNDTIVSGGGADLITGGRGDDIFEFDSGDSTPAAMARITDYKASDAMNTESDTIDLASTAIAADVEAADNLDVSSAAEGTGDDEIIAEVDDGIVTVFGLGRDRIDTLEEWIDVIGIVDNNDATAFEFGGNTYLMSGGDIIELTGVTGITAIDTTAADDTLLIA